METKSNNSNYNDIVFEGRNKEYGAYVLRRLYSKYVVLSTTSAAILFGFLVSYPFLTGFFANEENTDKVTNKGRSITLENILTEIANDKKDIEIPKTVSPKTPLVKFLVPEVKPDELASNDVIPTQEELSGKNPGTENIEGNNNGTDVVEEIIETKAPDDNSTEKIYTWAEEMPMFPGGDVELLKFFSENIVYPEIAKRAGVEGKVILTFVVDKNGNIIDIKVAKSIGAGCDEEAMRVLKTMPHWIPGKQNGNPVLTRINLPVVFKLR